MRARDRFVLCAVMVGILAGPTAMGLLAWSVHEKPTERQVKIQPTVTVRSV